MNLLFVCSKNQWRSRTAETIFKNNGTHQVKSAGTSNTARIKLTQWHLDWADLIFVMEQKHRIIIQSNFQIASSDERLIVLDIPDEYPYMDEALIAELETVVAYYLI
ncbi:MAG: protein tyrosine phosphatase [Bacteroidota bacterium]